MNNIQELIERLTDMCATEEGSPWPHDVMQCLIDCRSLLQAPLPDDVTEMIDYQNSVALVYGNERDRGIGVMLERLAYENQCHILVRKEHWRHIKRLEAAFRKIEQAMLPDPYDERDISLKWLRKTIHKIIDTARKGENI